MEKIITYAVLSENPVAPPILLTMDKAQAEVFQTAHPGSTIQEFIPNLSRNTIFPSARALLEAGVSCREVGGKGWAIYWMEGGAELTLFPRGEGPQEASSIDEIIEWIGGDQPAVLTPASLRRFGVK